MDKELAQGQIGQFVSYDVEVKDGNAVITLKIDDVKLVSDIENKVPGAIPHAILEAVKGFLIK